MTLTLTLNPVQVGRASFRPCLPCTLYRHSNAFQRKWWAYIEDNTPPVLLGQVQS